MSLAFHTADMPHLIPVIQDSDNSLTYLVSDLQARRHQSSSFIGSSADLEAWMNALQRQGQPLVATNQGRANLEAWLALVEA